MATPNYDLSDLGASPNHDLSDLGGTPVPQNTAATTGATAPFYQRIAPDIVSGLANTGQDIGNFPANIVNYARSVSPTIAQYVKPQSTSNIDFNSFFGAPKENANASVMSKLTNPDLLVQGAAGYAPFAEGEALMAAGKALPALARVGSQGLTNMAYGATQSPQNPVVGADLASTLGLAGNAAGAVARPIGTAIGASVGNQNAMNKIGNALLGYIRNQSAQGRALSPEDAAQNFEMKYAGVTAPGVNPDIGTITNNDTTRGLYGALQYLPFSGVGKNLNLLKNNLMDNQINDVQGKLQQQLTDPISQTLADQLGVIGEQQGQHAQEISRAPTLLKSLVPSDVDATQLNNVNADALRNVYQGNKQVANQKYNALEQFDNTRLDQFGGAEQYPSYSAAASDLLAQRENLKNLFDSYSDIGSKLNGELDKADSFLNNNETFGATLGDVRTRAQQLGKLAQQLYGAGNANEARLIMGLKSGLENDTTDVLNNNGLDNVGNMWHDATNYYRNNVTNFWDNPVIQKTVQKTVGSQPYVPSGTSLAIAIHNPNYQSILSQLPIQNRNMALAQLLTKNKGNFNLTPDQLASNYGSLDQTTKNAVASYNPSANETLNSLPTLLNNNDRLLNARDALSQQLEKTNTGNQKNINSLTDQLKNLQEQKYGSTNAHSATSKFIENAVKGGLLGGAALLGHLGGALGAAVPTMAFGRNLAKTMASPELVRAYMNNQRLPVRTPSGNINPLSYGLVPQAANYGGNQ